MSILKELVDLGMIELTIRPNRKICVLETHGISYSMDYSKSELEELIQELTELKDKMI